MKQINSEAIEARYMEYLENPDLENPQEARLSGLSAAMDDLVEHKHVTLEAVAAYEEAARRSGFYAGFMAAMEMLNRE